MGKQKLDYPNLEELAYATYNALNSIMGEFHAIRMVYKHIGQTKIYSNQEQFHLRLMCWSQFSSMIYRLWELNDLALKYFDYISPNLREFIVIAEDDDVTRLRHILHHIKDIRTGKMFSSDEGNPLMDSIYDKYASYLTGQKSVDFMNLLGQQKDLFEEKYPKFKDRFNDFGKNLFVPRV